MHFGKFVRIISFISLQIAVCLCDAMDQTALTLAPFEITPNKNDFTNETLKWKVQINNDELLLYLNLNNKTVDKTSLFLHSLGMKAVILAQNLRLENELKFSVRCNCWKLIDIKLIGILSNVAEFTVKSAVIKSYEKSKIIASKWFILKLDKSQSVAQGTSGNIIKFGDNINNKLFYHSCRPYVSIFINDSNVFVTQNNFYSSQKLALQIQNQEEETVVIQDVIMDLDGLLFIANGKIYSARFANNLLLLQHIKTSFVVTGITHTPVCFKSDYVHIPLENRDVFLWSYTTMYRISFIDVWSSNFDNIYRLQSLLSNNIVAVKYGTSPNEIVVAEAGTSDIKVWLCFILKQSPLNCKTVGKLQGIENGKFTLYIGNCIKFCAFLTTQDDVFYLSENKNERVSVGKNPIFISHNEERTLWLTMSNTELTFFSADGKFKHTSTDITMFTGYIPKLTINNNIMLLRCSENGNSIDLKNIEINNFVNLPKDIKTHFNFSTDTNVFSVSDLQHSVELNGHTSYPYNQPVFLDVDYNLGTSDAKVASKSKLSTSLTFNKTVTSMVFSMKIGLACQKKNILSCRKGMTKFSLQFKPKPSNSSIFYPSRIFFVNVTCPANIKLILGPKTTTGGCSSDINCTLTIKESDLVHLSFELHRGGKKLVEVKDDVVLTELNHRTGFYINNHYVLGRECFLCDQFYNLSTKSQLALQTQQSACPCKPNLFDHNTWTGNISFLGAVTYNNNEDNFYFVARVIDDSLCDHQTFFRIKIFINTDPTFYLWEYLIILVFFVVTLAALAISYKNYFTFMKENKDKMSATGLKGLK